MKILEVRATSDPNWRNIVQNITDGRESREYDAAIIAYAGTLFIFLSGGRYLGGAQRECDARTAVARALRESPEA